MEQLRKALDLDPTNWWAHANMGRCSLSKGMPSNAIAEFQKATSIESAIADPLAGLGMAYAALGNKAEATKVLNELQARAKQTYVSPYFIASVYDALGEKDQAFAWLDKAYKNRSWYLLALRTSPELDNLRSDPRFEKLASLIFPPRRSNSETPIQKP